MKFGLQNLDKELFKKFRDFIHRETGIYLKESKIVLLSNRLRKRVKALRLNSFYEYWEYLKDHPEEKEKLIDVVTTNETHFFRNPEHFRTLSDHVIPALTKHYGRTLLRIWSAAAASGEEPYSIAITLMENHPNQPFYLLATDISEEMLQRAKKGAYTEKRLREVPPEIKNKYFEKAPAENGTLYIIKDSVKRKVVFRKHNLLTPPPENGWHIVFCRNVLIYFDRETQQKVLDLVYRSMKEYSFLFLGHAETTYGLYEKFKPMRMGKTFVYLKEEKPCWRI